MKIAVVSQALPYLPSAGGFRLYGANLIKQFSRKHQVDLISFLEDEDEQHLDWARPFCASIDTLAKKSPTIPARVLNIASAYLRGVQLHQKQEFAALVRQKLRARKWDVIHVEGAFAGGLLPDDLGVPRVLSMHDSWTLRAEEMLKCSQSLADKMYYHFLRFHEPRYERMLYPRYGAVTVVAEPDLKAVRQTVPHADVRLIQYGTDTEYFHPLSVKKEEATLVFHSHLGYPPNIEAALEFANVILPLVRKEVPAAVFHLVGAKPGPKILELASRSGIRISADLPDLREAVCSGTVYVCAIRYGTGLKSKMLEAMAMRMPIVGYTPGSTVGLNTTHGKHLLEAREPAEFAQHVIALLKDPHRREQLASAACQFVEEKFSWESRAQAYESLYEEVRTKRLARAAGHN